MDDAVLTARERLSGTYIPRIVFPTISALSSTTPLVEQVIQTVAAHSMQLSTIRLLDLRVVVHRPTQQIP